MKKLIITGLFLLALKNLLPAQQEATLIDSLISGYVNDYKFTGSVLVSYKNKILLKKGYGYRDVDQKIPNNEKTIYNIASLTKSFTAALILKLQEAGKLSTNDKLNKYYPGYLNGDKITIHQLLTHTAGIFNYTNDKDFMSGDQTRPVTLEQMISLFKDKPLDFEPGSKFSYSNSGYTLLGYIIEKITGKPYSIVLQEMIFGPLSMKQTGYGFTGLKDLNKATGYQWYTKDNYSRANYIHPSVSYATGAIYCTIGDMYKWHLAWEGNFLTSESVAIAYKKDAGNYGYGWSTDSLYGKQRVSHSGNIPGFKSNINRFPQDDACVIILSNANNAEVGEMTRKIVALLYHQPIPQTVVPPVIEVADTLLHQYAGIYELSQKQKATISISGKQLKLEPAGEAGYELLAISPTVFRFKNADARIEFVRGTDGRVDAFYFYRGPQKIMCKKVR